MRKYTAMLRLDTTGMLLNDRKADCGLSEKAIPLKEPTSLIKSQKHGEISSLKRQK